MKRAGVVHCRVWLIPLRSLQLRGKRDAITSRHRNNPLPRLSSIWEMVKSILLLFLIQFIFLMQVVDHRKIKSWGNREFRLPKHRWNHSNCMWEHRLFALLLAKDLKKINWCNLSYGLSTVNRLHPDLHMDCIHHRRKDIRGAVSHHCWKVCGPSFSKAIKRGEVQCSIEIKVLKMVFSSRLHSVLLSLLSGVRRDDFSTWNEQRSDRWWRWWWWGK